MIMVGLRLSRHAEQRCQQRGISFEALAVLRRFGERTRSGDGFSYTMTKRSHRAARRAMGQAAYGKVADRISGCFMVIVADGQTVITVSHQTKLWKRR